MNNLQLPAYPTIESINHAGGLVEARTKDNGFTKLELASLMIAQGMMGAFMRGITGWSEMFNAQQRENLMKTSVLFAKSVNCIYDYFH
jgi:hypothetical protein